MAITVGQQMVPRLVRQVLSVAQAAVGTFGFAPAAKTAPLAVRAKVVRSMMTYRNPNDLLCDPPRPRLSPGLDTLST